MNPCASSFTPKMSYADKLKATLPPSTKPDKAKATLSLPKENFKKNEELNGGDTDDLDSQAQDQESRTTTPGQRLAVPTNKTTDRPTSRGPPESVLHNPHLRHLHEEFHIRQERPECRTDHASRQQVGGKPPTPNPPTSDGNRGFQTFTPVFGQPFIPNPLFAPYHYPPMPMPMPMPGTPNTQWQNAYFHGHCSRPGSALGAQSPFIPSAALPLQMTPSPTPMPVPYFFPPATGYGGYGYGSYPYPLPLMPSPLASTPIPSETTPHLPAVPQPLSRSEPESTTQNSVTKAPKQPGPRQQAEASHIRVPVENRVAVVSTRPAQPKAAEKPRSSTVIKAERGRPKYRLVSTTARRIPGSRNDHHSELGHEAGSESNDSCLTSRSTETVEDPTSASQTSRRSHDLIQTHQYFSLRKREISPAIAVGTTGPPPNAPTEPASMRRLGSTSRAKTQTGLVVRNSGEAGSWSQSKRWVSHETKERSAYQKMMHTLHYMRADKSPFLPQTPAALTAFRVADAERKSRQLAKALHRKVEALSRRKREDAERQRRGQDFLPKLELFAGKKMSDNLSPVFADDNCFNRELPPYEQRVEWPTLAELKEDGDKRAGRYGRYFPLPRMNQVASRVWMKESHKAYNTDGSLSWEKKALKQSGHFLMPVTAQLEPVGDFACEPLLQDLHQPLKDLLEVIDVEQLQEWSGKGEISDHEKETTQSGDAASEGKNREAVDEAS